MSEQHSRREVLQRAAAVSEEIARTHSSSTVRQHDERVVATSQTGQVAFWLSPKSKLDRAILHSVKSRILTSEVNFPGSGEICSQVCSRSIQMWIKRELSGEDQEAIRREFIDAVSRLEATRPARRRLREEDVERMLERVPDSIRSDLIHRIKRASLGSMISIRRTKSIESSVREATGCRVRVASCPTLSCSTEVVDPKIALIDGTIDSVGQIHRLLDDSCSSGSHYVIGCRGASEEVLRTVSVNCARGTIRVILFLARLDDFSVGSLDDLAACTGSWIVNAQSGESLTTGFDRLTRAKGKFWLEDGSLRMLGESSPDLERHILRLRADSESGDQSVNEFLGARILGLTSSKIEAFLGEADARSHPVSLEVVDADIRSLVSSVFKGVEEGSAPPEGVPDRVRRLLLETSDERLRCAGSSSAGWISGLRAAVELCSVGFAVIQ